jgi:cobalt-zinc-cadmium efflux system protein
MAYDSSHAAGSAARLFITMMLNFGITVAEVVGGIVSGSLSLISDALHNFSDGIAIIVAYIALRLSERARTENYTFGLKRAEIIAAVINASVLIAICFFLIREAYGRFMSPEPIRGALMIGVAGIGLFANIIGTLLLRKGSRGNLNIRAAYLHLFSDAVSSMAVIVGGIFIYLFDVYWVDPLLTVLISLYVLKDSFDIIKEAANVIMMGSPRSISLKEIKKSVEAIPGVRNIHHVHLWMLNERNIQFEAHVDIEDMMVSESERLREEIEDRLRLHNISHVTLQFECDSCDSKALI